LQYEDLLKDASKFTESLAKLVGVQPEKIMRCTGGLKAPVKKPMEGDRALMEKQLKEFFKQQEHLWPIISGAQQLPPLDVAPAPAARSQPRANVAPAKVRPDRFLQITWFTNLGFNNMRFILESALSMAHLLERRLMITPQLRMRKCTDPELCAKTKCTKRKTGNKGEEYWCPINAFVSWGPLKAAGAVITQDVKKFVQNKKRISVPEAYTNMFSDTTLYLDKMPKLLEGKLDSAGFYPKNAARVKLPYYRFHLGCELSYFEVKEQQWDSNRAKDRSKAIFSVAETFGNYTETILHLGGTPHNIGLTPAFWHSRDSLEESRAIWDSAVVYHPAIVKFAETVKEELVKNNPVKTYLCIHLRRGDFVSAGWLGEAENLGLVKKTIAEHRLKGEPVYMATDEANPDVLDSFRKLGIMTWGDFSEEAKSKSPYKAYLGFEDYVGLVEQSICGGAREFLGSKCSSFTGGILNLRRTGQGDTRYFTTAGKKGYGK
jgi:hypothetical protein